MPRTARDQSATGIYHVMIRGINRQDIFETPEDMQTKDRFKSEPCNDSDYFIVLMRYIHQNYDYNFPPKKSTEKLVIIKNTSYLCSVNIHN